MNKKITGIQYNYLNLPSRIQFEHVNSVSYLYGADRIKLRTSHVVSGVTTNTDYYGKAIYENGMPTKLLTGYGYITFSDTTYHYYLLDHQGNNRVIVGQTGDVEEVNHYYPFGGLYSDVIATNVQSFKYNSKELDRTNSLDWYDCGARNMDASLAIFPAVDPLCEKFYSVNPYAYCLNNPVKFIDQDGKIPILIPIIKGAVGGILDFGVQMSINMAQGESFSKSLEQVDWVSVGISTASSAIGMVGSSTATKVAQGALIVVDAAVDVSIGGKVEKSTLLGGEKSFSKSLVDMTASILPGKSSEKMISSFDKAITSDLKSKAAATLTKETKTVMRNVQKVLQSNSLKNGVTTLNAVSGEISNTIGYKLIEALEENRKW